VHGKPFRQVVAHQHGQVLDQLNALAIRPAGKLAGFGLELVHVEDLEAIATLKPFRAGLAAVALDQQVRRAPDLDLGYHTRKVG
jgi:hypothetical protein